MNIGKLDRKATIYSRTAGVDYYGSTTLADEVVAGYAWLKRINKKAEAERLGAAFPVEEKTYQFVSRYDSSTIKMGRYFTFSGDSLRYHIEGIQELGRQEGMLLTVKTQSTRNA
jgi:hypothetical protein